MSRRSLRIFSDALLVAASAFALVMFATYFAIAAFGR